MIAFARITESHDALALDRLTPCAQLLWRWLLRRFPAGKEQEIELDEFACWTGEYRRRPYCERHIKRALAELIDLALVNPIKRFNAHCWRLVACHPSETFSSQLGTKKSQPGTKMSKTEGSNPHCAVPHYREGREQQIPHPSHPAPALKNIELDEAIPKATAPTTTESDRTPTTTETPSTATPLPTSQAQNLNPTATSPTIEKLSQQLLEQIEDLDIRVNPQIEKVVLGATVRAVKDAIALVKQKRQQQQPLKNPAGFLVKAIENQWQPSVEGDSSLDRHPIADNPSTVDPTELRAQYEAIEREFDSPAYREARVRARQEIDRIRSLLEK